MICRSVGNISYRGRKGGRKEGRMEGREGERKDEGEEAMKEGR